MNLQLDAYFHLNSPLHRWEPRLRLVGLLLLIFAFAFVRDLRLLPAMILVTFGLYRLSRLPASFWWSRLRYPGMLLLLAAIMLPFVVGEVVVFRIGPLALREEGLWFVVLLVTRFVSIVTLGMVLFGTAPLLTSIEAMRALGLPAMLGDMLLLTYRYLHDLGQDLHTMQTAMRLRGFNRHALNRRSLGLLAALVGSLLVRSYDQSERVYHAMLLRGYGAGPARRAEWRVSTGDMLLLGVMVLLAVGFVGAEIWLRQYGG